MLGKKVARMTFLFSSLCYSDLRGLATLSLMESLRVLNVLGNPVETHPLVGNVVVRLKHALLMKGQAVYATVAAHEHLRKLGIAPPHSAWKLETCARS